MRIVIVGGGVVGQSLAEELVREDHDITVVDKDADLVRTLSERLDVYALCGDGGSPRVLEEAGLKDTELVIAVTDSDHLNMFICLLAETMGVKDKIARIRNDEYSGPKAQEFIRRKLSIDQFINPERLTVEHIAKLIAAPGATHAQQLAGGQVLIHSFNIHSGSPLKGQRLHQVRGLLPDEPFLIVALSRNGNMIVPTGEDEIQLGDRIHVLLAQDALPRFLPLVERRRAVQRAFIFDAGRQGLALTRMLESAVANVVLFEPDARRAKEAALSLEWTEVVQGSPSDSDLLKEYDVRSCDLFVAAAEHEEDNLMAALQAKRHGARKVIVVTGKHSNVALLESTGIDVVIEPKLLTVSEILSHVRGARVLSVARLEGDAEAIELLVGNRSKIVGKPLKELMLPKGVLLGAIIPHDDQTRVEIPGGDSRVQALDKVIVFTLAHARADAVQLLAPS